MKRPRIAVAGFQHETNTFAPIPTPFEIFKEGGAWPAMKFGSDVTETLSGLNLPMGGFLDEADDFDIVPILWTFAEPGGYVTDDAFDRIAAMIVDGVRDAGDIDGVYLDLHGAMVTQTHEDGEAELLRRVREVTGPNLPIAVSLDLHGNMSRHFFERASSVAIYRTYPHVDMAETGARARKLLREELARSTPYAKAWRQLDYIIPIQAQSTRREPGGRLYGMLPDLASDTVSSVDFVFGFPPADVADCGCSVFAFGTDQQAVDDAADTMLKALESAEDELHNPLVPATDAVAKASKLAGTATKPVLIADAQDNPGAGATGDTTGVLAALVDDGAQGAIIGMLWDPETAAIAHQAGTGAEINVAIGGKFPQLGTGPFKAKVRVEALSDGQFAFTGPMYGGAHANLGAMAALKVLDRDCDVTVVVGSNRTQNADQAIFTHMGIDPTDQAIVVVKSAVHFLADYEPIAETVIFAESPGANPCQLDRIPFTRLRKGVRLGPNGPAF
ncbi:MAG: M81 family metallopeptidase [Pseudomonadota bacterium]